MLGRNIYASALCRLKRTVSVSTCLCNTAIQMKEIYHLTGCTRGKKLLQQSVAKSNCSAT